MTYRIKGTTHNDTLRGGPGENILTGGGGADRLFGGPGADRLVGGPGADRLFGGPGADTFIFNSVHDSKPGHVDTIFDFVSGVDHIGLVRIDANVHQSGNQAFHFTNEFRHAGDLIFTFGLLLGDVDGDGQADLVIVFNAAPFHASDFAL